MKLIIENTEQKTIKEMETDLDIPKLIEIMKRDVIWDDPRTPVKWLAVISSEKVHLKMWRKKKSV